MIEKSKSDNEQSGKSKSQKIMNESTEIQPDESLTAAWNNPEKLPEMHEWLAEKRTEAAHAQYAFIVLKKHFRRAAVALKRDEVPTSLWRFGWLLYFNIDEFVTRRQHFSMLEKLFAELVDFYELISGEFFASNLLEMLEKFIDRDPPRSSVVPLLPDKALAQMDKIDEIMAERHEEYLRRMDQMGY